MNPRVFQCQVSGSFSEQAISQSSLGVSSMWLPHYEICSSDDQVQETWSICLHLGGASEMVQSQHTESHKEGKLNL
jgi:hypothetical protein